MEPAIGSLDKTAIKHQSEVGFERGESNAKGPQVWVKWQTPELEHDSAVSYVLNGANDGTRDNAVVPGATC